MTDDREALVDRIVDAPGYKAFVPRDVRRALAHDILNAIAGEASGGREKPAPYVDGWQARQRGLSTHANPYDDWTQRFSHGWWLEGWRDREAAAEKGGEFTHDY